MSEMLRDVRIVCEVVRNGSGNGFLPIITVNGWRHGNTYQSSGYDYDDALKMARQMAVEERDRHSGDWNVLKDEGAEQP